MLTFAAWAFGWITGTLLMGMWIGPSYIGNVSLLTTIVCVFGTAASLSAVSVALFLLAGKRNRA